MYSRVPKFMSWVLALAFVAFLPLVVAAQDSAKPSTTAGGDPTISKWDVFAGYSYLAPMGTTSNGITAESIDYGAILALLAISISMWRCRSKRTSIFRIRIYLFRLAAVADRPGRMTIFRRQRRLDFRFPSPQI